VSQPDDAIQARPTSPGAPAAPEKPRTFWDRVVTSTPIVLTVCATVLAGLSSGEMTRAQYYRALAAQHQSKVSDQWNFFQAKRIRGTSMDMTISVLRSATGAAKLSAESLQSSAARLPDDLKRADAEADTLLKAVDSARGDLGPAADRLREAGERFRTTVQAAQAPARSLAEALSEKKVQHSLVYLAVGTLPERADLSFEKRKELEEAQASLQKLDPEVLKSLNYVDPLLLKNLNDLNPAIPQALAEINARKTEVAMSATLARISEPEIITAIDAGEDKAREIEDLGKPPAATYREIDGLLAEESMQARAVQRAAQDVSAAAAAVPAGDARALNDVRLAAAAVARTGAALRAASDELGNDFKAAQLAYDARRYDREASSNRAVAGLYELDVRKASLLSDRHRERSKHFFNAMLAAQAGVTIATFALAVRFRSALWGLATVAGVVALALAAYVYLRM
jgi:hypothetical protein